MEMTIMTGATKGNMKETPAAEPRASVAQTQVVERNHGETTLVTIMMISMSMTDKKEDIQNSRCSPWFLEFTMKVHLRLLRFSAADSGEHHAIQIRRETCSSDRSKTGIHEERDIRKGSIYCTVRLRRRTGRRSQLQKGGYHRGDKAQRFTQRTSPQIRSDLRTGGRV